MHFDACAEFAAIEDVSVRERFVADDAVMCGGLILFAFIAKLVFHEIKCSMACEAFRLVVVGRVL